MKKVVIVGLNPGNTPLNKLKNGSPKLNRLARWCDELGIRYYSFLNCIDNAGDYTQLKANYEQLKEATKEYDKVIALGNYASVCLKKIKVEHHKMPHPSPRNRKFNDKTFEPQVVEECRKYLEQ